MEADQAWRYIAKLLQSHSKLRDTVDNSHDL